MTATTSCDVGPDGLLTTRTPSGKDTDDIRAMRRAAALRGLREPRRYGPFKRAAGGVLVAAAAELARDAVDVDVALRAQADTIAVRARFP